jgi:type VI secretion system ImpB/VipA family protein
LTFNSMDDFNPVNVVNQVEPLRKLFETRQRLVDLLAKLDGNDALDSLLQDVIANSDGLKELKTLVGGNGNGEEN